EATIARTKQRAYFIVWKFAAVGRGPRDKSNAIEAQQSPPCSYPQVAIRGLCNCGRVAGENSLLHAPGCVRVLRNSAGRIECPRRGIPQQEYAKRAGQTGCQRERMGFQIP